MLPPTRPHDLPDFDQPPISEVVLGIQFQTVGLRTFHSALVGQEFKELPIISEHPPLTPTFEVFGGNSPMVAMPPFVFSSGTTVPRYWFRSEDTTKLVQLQPDRLLRNWTKQTESDVYPRYHQIREWFANDIQKVSRFLANASLGSIEINQCEATYINTIILPDTPNPYAALHRIFRVWSNEYHDDQGREIEDATLNFTYKVNDANGTPCARLHATVEPVVQVKTGKKAVQLNLTVRGKPDGTDAATALMFLDTARGVIVRAFASMTRPEMHNLWRKKDG